MMSSRMPADPVEHWLREKTGSLPKLDLCICLDLPWGPLMIRSFSERVMHAIKSYFTYYSVTEKRPSKATLIEIYTPVGDKGDMAIAPPHEAATQESARTCLGEPRLAKPGKQFDFFAWDTLECLWRNPDLLVSLRWQDTGRARILATSPKPGESWSSADGGIRRKGEANLDEIVQLVFSIYLRSRGLLGFHAASAAYQDKGVLFSGPSGSGKTTTVLALARNGFDLLGDEIVVAEPVEQKGIWISGLLISPRFVGSPPESLDDLEKTLQRPTLGSKTEWKLPAQLICKIANNRAPLAAMFFLQPGEHVGADHACEPINSMQAFPLLMDQMLDHTGASRQKEIAFLAMDLAQSVPAYKLTTGRNLNSLADLIRGVL